MTVLGYAWVSTDRQSLGRSATPWPPPARDDREGLAALIDCARSGRVGE